MKNDAYKWRLRPKGWLKVRIENIVITRASFSFFWHTTCIPNRNALSSTHTENSDIEPKCSDTFVFTSENLAWKNYCSEHMTQRSIQTEHFQDLSTVVLNANQPNTRQVTFIDVTDCCGVKVSFEYSAPCLQNTKSTTTRCVSGKWVRGGAVGRDTEVKGGRSRVRFMMGSLGSFIDLILPAALWMCDRLSLWHKWAPRLSHRGKGGRCEGLQPYYLHVPIVHKFWETQPPLTLRACRDL